MYYAHYDFGNKFIGRVKIYERDIAPTGTECRPWTDKRVGATDVLGSVTVGADGFCVDYRELSARADRALKAAGWRRVGEWTTLSGTNTDEAHVQPLET